MVSEKHFVERIACMNERDTVQWVQDNKIFSSRVFYPSQKVLILNQRSNRLLYGVAIWLCDLYKIFLPMALWNLHLNAR